MKIEASTITFVVGPQTLLDMIATAIVTTAQSGQWMRYSNRPFVPPNPKIQVFDWGDPKIEEAADPEENSVTVLDNFQDCRITKWSALALREMTDLHKTATIVLWARETEGDVDLESAISDEHVRKYWEENANYRVVLAERHMTSVVARVYSGTDGEVADIALSGASIEERLTRRVRIENS